MTITDPRDPRVADFHDLHAGDRRPGTERGTGPVVVEGVTAVERLLASGLPVRCVYGVPGRVDQLAVPAGVPVHVADKWVLSETIGFRLTRGVLASCERPVPPALPDLLAGARRIAVLEGLNDHENIGSIARSAWALGVDALLLDPTCADPYYRRAVRVSMGHLLTTPLRVLPDWPGDLERVRSAGFTTVALTPGADVDLAAVDPVAHPRTAVLLGAEGPGLSAAAMDAVDVRARIPMRPGVDSLGVAAAAAVVFATLR
ncbi:RNA methyltransferase [Klenkia sp. LSe6-5]|uniref:RNA methyltransferase n=1 Tax=Klenkia sesuvii TaxID=3103137 RepID=A0ABU8DW18_9ACTN